MINLKRISLIFIVGLLFLIGPIVSSAKHGNKEINSSNDAIYKTESELETQSVPSTIIKVLAKVLFNVGGNVRLSNNPGSVIDQGNAYLVNHKNVKFNSNGINTQVRKDVTAYGQDTIRPFMQKNQLLVGNAQLLIYNNGTKVLDRSVKSGNSVSYKVPGGRNNKYTGYYIYYGSNNTENWYPKMYYLMDSNCGPCLPTRALEKSNLVMKDDQVYAKQTQNPFITKDKRVKKDVFTMNELFSEFYNNDTDELSDQTRTLTSGDQVTIRDVITDLKYNEAEDHTLFSFVSEYSEPNYHTVAFKGDIMNRFKTGDSLELNFKIVATDKVEGNEFVDLDYNIYTQETGEFPSIDLYIKK